MGIISGLRGNASEIKLEKVQEQFAPILIEGEVLEKAFKVIRDLYVFTNKRMILVDKQGVTGKKAEYLTIPYKSITKFAKESTGLMDFDAELKIWLSGHHEPIKKEFKKNNNINEVYQILSKYVLK